MRTLGILQVLLLGTLLLVYAYVRAQEAAPEAVVKAAYVYNFGKFVEWPGAAPGADFRICTIGRNDPFLDAVQALGGRALQGRPVTVRRIDGAPGEAGCSVLVVGASEARQQGRILAAAEGHAVLTVSDIRGFASNGGMIGLVLLSGDRIGFEINARAARQAGLKLSATLVDLARPLGEAGRP